MKRRTSLIRLVLRSAAALMAVLLGLLAFVKFEYGTGKLYPDIGADNPEGARKLEKLIRLDYPPGNLDVAPNGHFFSSGVRGPPVRRSIIPDRSPSSKQ